MNYLITLMEIRTRKSSVYLTLVLQMKKGISSKSMSLLILDTQKNSNNNGNLERISSIKQNCPTPTGLFSE